jgi:N-acetylmuramic acid 6-phosphate etherase
MVDLRASNAKLVDRGERIVMEVSGAGRDAARAAIEASGGSVRTAIVMATRGVGREQAESLLAEHDNHLRPIIGDPSAPPSAPPEE